MSTCQACSQDCCFRCDLRLHRYPLPISPREGLLPNAIFACFTPPTTESKHIAFCLKDQAQEVSDVRHRLLRYRKRRRGSNAFLGYFSHTALNLEANVDRLPRSPDHTCFSPSATAISGEDLLGDQGVEDLANSFGALLWVPLLTTFVVDKGDAKPRFVTFRPFEVAAKNMMISACTRVARLQSYHAMGHEAEQGSVAVGELISIARA